MSDTTSTATPITDDSSAASSSLKKETKETIKYTKQRKEQNDQYSDDEDDEFAPNNTNNIILDENFEKQEITVPKPPTTTSSYTSSELANLPHSEKLAIMEDACRTILQCIGEDPEREGLRKTPKRWANALLYMTQGYSQSAKSVMNEAIFSEEEHREMVIVKDIDIHSLCEHHILPFTGQVHVAYIPNGQILGISKIARIADVFARRLQVQERLTTQIAEAIVEEIKPLGVAVVVEGAHYCMIMRGVQKVGAKTVTSSFRGCFETDDKKREEFLRMIRS